MKHYSTVLLIAAFIFLIVSDVLAQTGGCIGTHDPTILPRDLSEASVPDADVTPGQPPIAPHGPADGIIHAAGAPLAVRFTVRNDGVRDLFGVRAHIRIVPRFSNVERNGSFTFDSMAVIDSVGRTGGERVAEFGEVTIGERGRYDVVAVCDHPSDLVKGNDTARWTFRIGLPFGVDIVGGVFIEGTNGSSGPIVFPAGKPLAVRAWLDNIGDTTAPGVPVRVLISRFDGGEVIFDHTVTVPEIREGVHAYADFPSFIPPSEGTYVVSYISSFPDDINRSDDTSRWPISVGSVSGVASWSAAAAPSVDVRPIPASSVLVVDYMLADARGGEMALYDIAGRPVRSAFLPGRSGSLDLPVADLPPGVYAMIVRSAAGWDRRMMVMVER